MISYETIQNGLHRGGIWQGQRGPARAKEPAAAPAMRSGGRRVSRIRDPGRCQPPFPKGGKGLALEAGTVVRALFITIDSKL